MTDRTATLELLNELRVTLEHRRGYQEYIRDRIVNEHWDEDLDGEDYEKSYKYCRGELAENSAAIRRIELEIRALEDRLSP